jgi:MraZ protein
VTDFLGKFSYKVDKKGRVVFPPKFAKHLSMDLIITHDPVEKCLLIFEPEEFNEWVKRFFEKDGGFQQFNAEHVRTRSKLKGDAMEVTIDSSGKINIPSAQQQDAEITSEAVFIGNDGYIELWSPENRAAFESGVTLADTLYGTAN